MKFSSDFRFLYFSNLLINSKLLRELDGLVVNRVIMQLCRGYLGVILGTKGLKLIGLSKKDNSLNRTLTLWDGPPPLPLNPCLYLSNLSEPVPPIQW